MLNEFFNNTEFGPFMDMLEFLPLRNLVHLTRVNKKMASLLKNEQYKKLVERKKIVKIGLFGDSQVGKTAWLKRILQGEFDSNCPVVMEDNIHHSSITKVNGEKIAIQIEDNYGEDCNIQYAFVMFDLLNIKSFESARLIVERLKQKNSKKETNNERISILLMGTKADVPSRPRNVGCFPKMYRKYTDGEAFFKEISSRSGYNMDAPLRHVAQIHKY